MDILKNSAFKKKGLIYLCLALLPLTKVGATGIINTQSVLISEETKAKEALEKEKKEVFESIDLYAEEIEKTNKILYLQIKEQTKILFLKKKILMDYQSVAHQGVSEKVKVKK